MAEKEAGSFLIFASSLLSFKYQFHFFLHVFDSEVVVEPAVTVIHITNQLPVAYTNARVLFGVILFSEVWYCLTRYCTES
jgi:hypothetical protein